MEIEQWSVYWANLDPTLSSEQAGRRPVLVISADAVNVLNTVTVLPLTSYKESRRKIRVNEVLVGPEKIGIDRESVILGHQIRILDKARLESVAGKIMDEETKEAVIAALKVQLGI